MGAGTSKDSEKIKVPEWALRANSDEEDEKENLKVKKSIPLPIQ